MTDLPGYQSQPWIDKTPFHYSEKAQHLIGARTRPPKGSRTGRAAKRPDMAKFIEDLEYGVVVARNDALQIREGERGVKAVREELAAIRRAARDLAKRLREAGRATAMALRANGGVALLQTDPSFLTLRDFQAQVEALGDAADDAQVFVAAAGRDRHARSERSVLSIDAVVAQLLRVDAAAYVSPLSHAMVRPSRGASTNWGAVGFARQCLEQIFPLHLGVEPRGDWARDLLEAAFEETELRRGSDVKRVMEAARASRRNDITIRVGPVPARAGRGSADERPR